jgi:hypothetical protein
MSQPIVEWVAVGISVTRHPPHSSRRAARPHRAPASGDDAQAPAGAYRTYTAGLMCQETPARWPTPGGLRHVALGPLPAPPPAPPVPWDAPCSTAASGLCSGPTPCTRPARSCPSGAPGGPGKTSPGQRQGLPGSAQSVFTPARGLRPRQVRGRLAVAAPSRLPSACAERVGPQEEPACGAPYAAGTFPCQRFAPPVTDRHA